MREYLTASDICNQMSMERSSFDGIYLVVEGVTDERLYEKFIDKESVKIVEAHSKDNVKGSVRCMQGDRRDPKVIGITDADLDRLNGKKAQPPMFHTDCRDLEMMIMRSNALEDVLDEYCDQERLDAFCKRFGQVRNCVVSAGYPIGLLMHISQREGLGLCFKNLPFYDFIDTRSLSLDASRMVEAVIFNSKSCRMSRKALLRRLSEEAERLDDQWLAVRGHDAVDILLIGLHRTFGAFNSKSLNEGELGGALRLAFSDECFRGTDLYKDTSAWAEERSLSLWSLV